MAITIHGPTHFDPLEKILDELERLIDMNLLIIARTHFHSPTQEPPLTARIAQAIEMLCKGAMLEAGDLQLDVETQDVPSIGVKTEKHIGADLYISLVRRDIYPPIAKGMLIQSKWEHKLKDARLPEQIEQMLVHSTDSSYVWSFGPNGISAFEAQGFDASKPPRTRISVGKLIADGLRCNRGAKKLGRDLSLDRPEAMTLKMKELDAAGAIEFAIRENGSRRD